MTKEAFTQKEFLFLAPSFVFFKTTRNLFVKGTNRNKSLLR